MKSVEAGWRRMSEATDGLEHLCAVVNDSIRLQVSLFGFGCLGIYVFSYIFCDMSVLWVKSFS